MSSSGAIIAYSFALNAIMSAIAANVHAISSHDCDGLTTYELVTGYSYSGQPADTMRTITDVMQLPACLSYCTAAPDCESVNFETGLCILLNSTADTQNGVTLKSTQFPVFTIYAQKICVKGGKAGASCLDRTWSYERVIGFQLSSKYGRKVFKAPTRVQCMELCLEEEDFECRSVNFDSVTLDCTLSDIDRQGISSNKYRNKRNQVTSDANFGASPSGQIDYLENNCVRDPKQCDFKPIKGLILKTVDSVYENVRSIEACKKKCLDAPYRCFSFDFGADSDPANGGFCRISHINTGTVLHIEQPFVEMPGAITYQLISCLNVSVLCLAHEMVATIKTNKLFNGKVYSRSKPNSCVNDVVETLQFDLHLPYNDLMCDVTHATPDTFKTEIVVQHHDLIVTQMDMGLAVVCKFDLNNQTITNTALHVEGSASDLGEDGVIQATTVQSPNVSMIITDAGGSPIQVAQVGDPLTLQFEITDSQSPYEIFVRELVAVDGVDSSEIVLIDSNGCPTDVTIMSTVTKGGTGGKPGTSSAKKLRTSFEAFKFPASNIVQFRALITPCLSSCKPVQCNLINGDTGSSQEVVSYGKRRRRAAHEGHLPANETLGSDEEVVVVNSIKITDAFSLMDERNGRNPKQHRMGQNDGRQTLAKELAEVDLDLEAFELDEVPSCMDVTGLIVASCIFLAAQLTLIGTWYVMWTKIKGHRDNLRKQSIHGFFTNPIQPMAALSPDINNGFKYNDIFNKINTFYEI